MFPSMSDDGLEREEREEAAAFDAEFQYMIDCDAKLDDVIQNLRMAGILVGPDQRVIVSKWLDMFSEDSPIPLRNRLALLRGLLQSLEN